jgi:hypothetical protein
LLAWQKEDEKWKRDLSESLDADHMAIMKLLSSVTLVQQAADSKLTESQGDMRKLLNMIQQVRHYRKCAICITHAGYLHP